ncbi:hypothetical protein N7475_001590 [Penicillium sp. IBT 31633x]|nr:hypothetical protein N7475_001590 [Penicillium sp. IBT 31633x]
MEIQVPLDVMEVFNEGNKYALEDGKLFVYGLKGTTTDVVQEICKQATESYAKDILNWPHGRLAKPEIFSPVDEGPLDDLGDCFKYFVKQLRDLFDSSPPKQLLTYPHAFIAVSKDEMPNNAILVIAYESCGIWKLEYRSVPIQVELGQFVDSLRMGDESPEDRLDRYNPGPAKTTSNNSDYQPISE